MSNRYLELQPSNIPPNQTISYAGGNPIVSFDVAMSPADLIGGSVRLFGNLKVTTDGSTTPTPASTLAMDSRLGVLGLFSDVVISSTRTKQVIEHIRHYDRFMASYYPLTASNEDINGHLSQATLSTGSLQGSQGQVLQQGDDKHNQFCVFTPTGFLQSGEPIPLDHIGGVTIDYHLNPDSQFLFDTAGTPVASGLSGAQYSLEGLRLSCEVHDRSAEEQAEADRRKMNGFEYNSISSYYSTINATNGILNYSLGLSRVKSVFMNFIQSSYLQNLAQNSLQTIMPIIKGSGGTSGAIADIEQIVFTRGGVRFPEDYNLDTNYKEDSNVSVVDPQVVRNFQDAIAPFSDMNRNVMSPVVANRNWSSNDNEVLDGGLVYGVGMNYDNLGGDGVDFSRTNWGVQIVSKLTDDNPISVFVFVHAKQTLLFSEGQGIQVIN